MSLSSRRAFLALPLALAACGFTPVYAPGETGAQLRGKVEVMAPTDVNQYVLVRTLEDRLGRAATPSYQLAFVLRTGVQGQAVTSSNETLRYSIVGAVSYTLRSAETEAIVASGEVDNFTGFSARGSTVEALAAERDAYKRLMVILADQITNQLYATAGLPE